MSNTENIDTSVVMINPPIRKKIGTKQEGTIKIGGEIIDLLSEGIYTSPENALKELISNSYDSDASYSRITYDKKRDVLIVKDDGVGMDYVDFDNKFTFISGSDKRKSGSLSKKFGRPLIGKIGIGFVSASQLCERMIVRSGKENVDTKFEAIIDWGKIRAQIKEAKGGKKEFYEVSKYTLTNYAKRNKRSHYTVIELHNLAKEISDILNNRVPRYQQQVDLTKEKNFTGIVYAVAESVRKIEREVSSYYTFILNLASIIPVPYLKNGPIREVKDTDIRLHLEELKQQLIDLGFRVTFDDYRLSKPILLPCRTADKKKYSVSWLKKTFEFPDGSKLKIRGYFYNQQGRIDVENWQGVVIRIKNVAVGGVDGSFMDFPYPGERLLLPWTYGEIYADEGLEDAMNINRSSFKVNHPHYVALRDFVHKYLHDVTFDHAKELYLERKSAKSRKTVTTHQAVRNKMAEEGFGRDYSVVEVSGQSNEAFEVNEKTKELEVYTGSDIFSKLKKPQRILLEDVVVAFETALRASNGDVKELRKKFFEYLERFPRDY